MAETPDRAGEMAPIIVLAGPGVPGQTLAAALGRNPAAYDLPACNLELLPMMDGFLREMSGMRAVQIHGLLRALSQLLGGEQSIASVAMARRWLSRRMHLSTAVVAQEIAALVAPRRMVMAVTAALFDEGARDRLIAAFPGARFVHLQMHPLHQGSALMAEAGGAAALLMGAREAGASETGATSVRPDPQAAWLMTEDAVAALRAAVPEGRVTALRVEDVLAAPERVLGDLAATLGLPDDPQARQAMGRPDMSPFAGPGPFGAHLGGDVRSFAALRQALVAARGPVPRAGAAQGDGRMTVLTAAGLPWDPRSTTGLRPEVIARARALGYA